MLAHVAQVWTANHHKHSVVQGFISLKCIWRLLVTKWHHVARKWEIISLIPLEHRHAETYQHLTRTQARVLCVCECKWDSHHFASFPNRTVLSLASNFQLYSAPPCKSKKECTHTYFFVDTISNHPKCGYDQSHGNREVWIKSPTEYVQEKLTTCCAKPYICFLCWNTNSVNHCHCLIMWVIKDHFFYWHMYGPCEVSLMSRPFHFS